MPWSSLKVRYLESANLKTLFKDSTTHQTILRIHRFKKSLPALDTCSHKHVGVKWNRESFCMFTSCPSVNQLPPDKGLCVCVCVLVRTQLFNIQPASNFNSPQWEKKAVCLWNITRNEMHTEAYTVHNGHKLCLRKKIKTLSGNLVNQPSLIWKFKGRPGRAKSTEALEDEV